MYPKILQEHIRKCKAATSKPFGVNVPLLYPQTDELIEIILREKVPVVFTSAGNPGKYTASLKKEGLIVVHVIANTRFALKAAEAGVDAIVAEGFEAGGHNGLEETTTMALIPMIKEVVDIPVIAAGGIATGRQMLAAFALGAEGVQVGSLFVASAESSAHPGFKQMVVDAGDGATALMMKKLVPVRLMKNKFFEQVKAAEMQGAGAEELKSLLGKGRAKKGMFEGDLTDGELEIGQVAALIHAVKPAGVIIDELVAGYEQARQQLCR